MSESNEVHFRYWHGLGDAALFAPALRLWLKRGYKVAVDCTEDKACLFEAVGAEVRPGATVSSSYWHPPHPGHPEMGDIWSGNKLAYNLCEPPLPHIGTWDDLYPEYLASCKSSLKRFVTKKSRTEIDTFLATFDGPLVLFHPQGNTSAREKNVTGGTEVEFLRHVQDKTDATVLTLDWDNRVNRGSSRRVRHLMDDFRAVTIPELWYLIERAACLVGVDSGPLHLAEMWTSTPVVGMWSGHHPAHFSIPRRESAHLVTGIGSGRQSWNKYRRHTYNVIEVGDRVTGAQVAVQVERVLNGHVGRELVVEDLLDRVHIDDKKYMDRDRTFRMVLDHLKGKTNPVMIETGCIRQEDDWTAGYSSYIFGMALDGRGRLDSVDIDGGNVAFARKWVAGFPWVTIHQSDSLAWLEAYTGPTVDVAYLDSLDSDQPGHAEHGLREAQLVLPHLAADGKILFDDTFWERGAWVGKGKLAIPFLVENGFRIEYSGYQTLLSR